MRRSGEKNRAWSRKWKKEEIMKVVIIQKGEYGNRYRQERKQGQEQEEESLWVR